jgi:DNA modification methylase
VTEWLNRVHFGDCLETLRRMPDGLVQTCVTSPPYYGLRDYGHAGQIGLEATPEEFIAKLVAVFAEVRRVLRDDGTCWVNIGDSYATAAGATDDRRGRSGNLGNGGRNGVAIPTRRAGAAGALKAKDLIGVPWMLAFALRAGFSACDCCGVEKRSDIWPVHNGHRVCIDCALQGKHSKVLPTEPGWYLRQDIIWAKPNPMPESVTDRCTKAHEYVFLLSKSERYYFDQGAIAEVVAPSTTERLSQPTLDQQEGSHRVPGKTNGPMKAVGRKALPDSQSRLGDFRDEQRRGSKRYSFARPPKDGTGEHGQKPQHREDREDRDYCGRRNKRSVWTVTTKPYTGAHFAVFPPDLIEPCILAGAPAGGVVLDPFFGSGTTGEVAQRLGRAWIGCELNPEYESLQRERLRQPGLEFTA